MPAHKGGKKQRKWGRNEAKCKRYAAEHRLERNKKSRMTRIENGFKKQEA